MLDTTAQKYLLPHLFAVKKRDHRGADEEEEKEEEEEEENEREDGDDDDDVESRKKKGIMKSKI